MNQDSEFSPIPRLNYSLYQSSDLLPPQYSVPWDLSGLLPSSQSSSVPESRGNGFPPCIFNAPNPAERPLHTLYMDTFKVTRCENSDCRDETCLKAHKGEMMRRKPYRLESGFYNYTSTSCADLQCAKPSCPFSHTYDERLYHPEQYKTTFCSYTCNEDGACQGYGRHCPFAHSQAELRSPAIFNLRDSSHKKPDFYSVKAQQDWARSATDGQETCLDIVTYKIYKCPSTACKLKPCAYFHNQYDRRRDPKTCSYCSVPCKNVYDVARKKFSHPDKCKNGDECKYAHTKFEAYYHPSFYRTQVCSQYSLQGRCDRGAGCAFLHPQVQSTTTTVTPTPPQLYPNSMLSSLLQSNQRLVKEHESLKSQLEGLKGNLKTLKKKVTCPVCKTSGKSVYLSCGHLLCEVCSTSLAKQPVRKCPICAVDTNPLCAMRL